METDSWVPPGSCRTRLVEARTKGVQGLQLFTAIPVSRFPAVDRAYLRRLLGQCQPFFRDASLEPVLPARRRARCMTCPIAMKGQTDGSLQDKTDLLR